MKIKLHILILILMLGLISSRLVINQQIIPYTTTRIGFEREIYSNNSEPPYQYRILQPWLARILQIPLSTLGYSPEQLHVVSHSLVILFVFISIYYLFALYLAMLFSETTVVIGLLLFQACVPLSISGFYMDGDFFTVLFYLISLILLLRKKDAFLPFVILLSTMNREQTIFIVLLYGIYLYSQNELFGKRLGTLILCVATYLLVYWGIRLGFGLRSTQYTVLLHLANNTNLPNLVGQILPLWTAEVFGLVILSFMAYRKSNRFFKLSFISLTLYFSLFFINGNLWELGKFLPAFLIMIPISLQILAGEFIVEENGKIKLREILSISFIPPLHKIGS